MTTVVYGCPRPECSSFIVKCLPEELHPASLTGIELHANFDSYCRRLSRQHHFPFGLPDRPRFGDVDGKAPS